MLTLTSGMSGILSIVARFACVAAVIVPCVCWWYYRDKCEQLQNVCDTIEQAYKETLTVNNALKETIRQNDETIKSYVERVNALTATTRTEQIKIKEVIKSDKQSNDWSNTVIPDAVRVQLQ